MRKFFCSGLGFFLFFLACQSPEQQPKPYTIGFSQCIGTHDWRKKMEKDMYGELYFHQDLELTILDAKGDVEQQKQHIRSLIEQKVDVLIISPLEAEPLVEMVELASSRGIPTILLDRKVNTDIYTTYVGADNYEIGFRAGTYVRDHFPQAHILEIWGLKGSSPAIERHRGFHDGIKGSQVNVLTEIQLQLENENFSIDKSPLLDNLQGVDLIFGHTDAITYNSYKIIQENQPQSRISYVGIDGLFGENLGIDLVDKGILKATFLYPTGGKEAIELAKKILEGKAVDKHYSLISTQIDSSNLELIMFQEGRISEQQSNIELQQQVIQMQNSLSTRQRNTIFLMVLISLLILTLSALLFRSLQQKRRQNRELTVLNEEISRQKTHIEQVSEQVKTLTEEKIRYFISVSHEFRTPLTLILTPLKEMIRAKEQRTSFNLNLIKKNTIRLQRLINQLMDFRKIEFNQLNMAVSEIGLEDFISDLMLHFEHLANSKSIRFELHSLPQSATLWADKNLLDKVIFNLLSNAFKFTPKGGKIIIALEEKTDQIAFRVKNTGPRISENQAQKIFDRYYTHGDRGGVGIGLALSREFVQLHKGSIGVDTEDQDFTTFVVKLPKGKSHFPQDTIYQTEEVQILREENDAFLEIETPQQILPPSDEELPYVLIIEDNADLTQYLFNTLSHLFNVLVANNSREGLKIAGAQIPDVIVCDIQMAHLDGYEILEKLKEDVKTSHIPIIMLTANQSEAHKLEALKKGADSYVTKPFSLELLVENIKGQLANRNLLKRYYAQLFGISEGQNDADIRFINAFRQIIVENLDNAEFTVEQIYRQLGLSRIQLYRKVKAILGCGVHDYLLDYRIREAKRLLSMKNLSIKEIAYQTGFTSPSYFSTVFKTKLNITPSEYRNSL